MFVRNLFGLSGLQYVGVEPAVVSAQDALQPSHSLLDLCDQLVALQTLVAVHHTALPVGFSRWGQPRLKRSSTERWKVSELVLEECFEAPTAEERGELFQQQGVLQASAYHFGFSSRWNPQRRAPCPVLYYGD
jgi:hypothetical protein